MSDGLKITLYTPERWGFRIIKNGITCVVASGAFFGPGVFLDSQPMQWFGFLSLILLVHASVTSHRLASLMTPDEARKAIDEWEAER